MWGGWEAGERCERPAQLLLLQKHCPTPAPLHSSLQGRALAGSLGCLTLSCFGLTLPSWCRKPAFTTDHPSSFYCSGPWGEWPGLVPTPHPGSPTPTGAERWHLGGHWCPPCHPTWDFAVLYLVLRILRLLLPIDCRSHGCSPLTSTPNTPSAPPGRTQVPSTFLCTYTLCHHLKSRNRKGKGTKLPGFG